MLFVDNFQVNEIEMIQTAGFFFLILYAESIQSTGFWNYRGGQNHVRHCPTSRLRGDLSLSRFLQNTEVSFVLFRHNPKVYGQLVFQISPSSSRLS